MKKIKVEPSGLEETLELFYQQKFSEIQNFVKHYINKIRLFDVNVKLDGSAFTASIDYPDQHQYQNIDYHFYLLKDGKVIDRQGWYSSNTYQWTLTESGTYCVQGYVRTPHDKALRRSVSLSYYTQESRQEYEKFLNEYKPTPVPHLNSLDLYRLKYPFHDILIISNKSLFATKHTAKIIQKAFPDFHILGDVSIGQYRTFILGTGGKKELSDGSSLIFSGTTALNNKLIFGVSDLPDDVTYNQIVSGCGDNTCVHIGDSIRLGTDYFNFGRWFYSENKNLTIISNRYHTMLLAMRQLGISMQLDEEKACITLSTVDVQFLVQNFSRNMDIHHIYQLENDKDLILEGSSGWTKQTNEYGRVLASQEVFHENVYHVLLKCATDEMIQNTACAIHDDRFENTLIDLTGGLDSRMIYSCATNIPHAKEKVKIVSYPVVGSEDLPIATEINSIYGFDYNDLPTTSEALTMQDGDQLMRSFFMGTYYAHTPFSQKQIDPKFISLYGACGEILARPYMVRKYFNTMAENCNSEESFARYIWSDFAANLIVSDHAISDAFYKYIGSELNNIPTPYVFEKYDRMYLQYRHSYHFGHSLRLAYMGPSWMPLQSKTAFRLHHMTFPLFKSIRLQLDMLAQLNPMLLGIRFDYHADNTDFAKEQSSLLIDDIRLRNIRISGTDDMERWTTAREQKQALTQSILTEKYTQEKEQFKNTTKAELLYSALLNNFQSLMLASPALSQHIGPGLYRYILQMKNNLQKTQYLYNKITSLLDQLNIIQ